MMNRFLKRTFDYKLENEIEFSIEIEPYYTIEAFTDDDYYLRLCTHKENFNRLMNSENLYKIVPEIEEVKKKNLRWISESNEIVSDDGVVLSSSSDEFKTVSVSLKTAVIKLNYDIWDKNVEMRIVIIKKSKEEE